MWAPIKAEVIVDPIIVTAVGDSELGRPITPFYSIVC